MIIIEDVQKYYDRTLKTFISLVKNEKFEKILGALGRFGMFGIKNILLILEQAPDAHYVNSMKGWNFSGRYVIPTANAIQIVKKQKIKEDPYDDNSKEEIKHVIGLVYEHKWTKQATYSSRKDTDDFTHVFSADRVMKYPKGILHGICDWATRHSKANDQASQIARNEIISLLEGEAASINEVERAVGLASKLIAADLYIQCKNLQDVPELKTVFEESAKYIICERFEMPKPESVGLKSKLYIDVELEHHVLGTLYPLRFMTQKLIGLMEARAYNHEINHRFEEERKKERALNSSRYAAKRNNRYDDSDGLDA